MREGIPAHRWRNRLRIRASEIEEWLERRGGVIVKRGSSYGVSVYDTHPQRKRWIGTFPTRREAKDAERNASQKRRASTEVTCDEFARRWQWTTRCPPELPERRLRVSSRDPAFSPQEATDSHNRACYSLVMCWTAAGFRNQGVIFGSGS